MNGERLFRILGWVDEDLIEEADTASSPAASRPAAPLGPGGSGRQCVRSSAVGGGRHAPSSV